MLAARPINPLYRAADTCEKARGASFPFLRPPLIRLAASSAPDKPRLQTRVARASAAMTPGKALVPLLRVAVLAAILAAAWWYRSGFGDVAAALAQAGWIALAAVTAWHLLPLVLCAAAWRSLLPEGRLPLFLNGRWVREAVGDLAGFLPLSGEVTGARMIARGGLRMGLAAGLTVVDVTAETLAQFFYVLAGALIWLLRHPDGDILRWTLIGLGASVPVLAGLLLIQRSPLVRFLETLPSRILPVVWRAPDAASGTRAAIHEIWSHRGRLVVAVCWHLAAWVSAAGEAWVALYLLGRPLPVADIVALESVIQALRTAAFIIPGGWGVQEGAYVVVGAALGLPAEAALAISLLKRGREIILGIPGLLAWQYWEGRRRT